MKYWQSYFGLLLDFEGTVFENDPDDPGGATKYGIDQRSHPNVDIANLTREQAHEIYLSEFGISRAASLPEPFAEVYFDFVVNAGENAAGKALQRALGMSVIDGIVGAKTMAEFKAQVANDGIASVLARFTHERATFYRRLGGNWKRAKYLNGWLRRNARVNEWAVNLLRHP